MDLELIDWLQRKIAEEWDLIERADQRQRDNDRSKAEARRMIAHYENWLATELEPDRTNWRRDRLGTLQKRLRLADAEAKRLQARLTIARRSIAALKKEIEQAEADNESN